MSGDVPVRRLGYDREEVRKGNRRERRKGMSGETYRCANCEKEMRSGEEVYGLGVRLKAGMEYPEGIGRRTAVHLPVRGRMLECMATADGSRARAEGWDLIFMVCSEECGAELKALLESEESLFEEIM